MSLSKRFFLIFALLSTMLMVSVASISSAAGHVVVVDFEGLAEGSIVSSLTAGAGYSGTDIGAIGVNGFNKDAARGFGNANTAMIFDGNCVGGCTGNDPDLQSNTGNILIITQDGNAASPNDEAHGGVLTFTFPFPVNVDSLFIKDAFEGGFTILANGNPVAGHPGGGVDAQEAVIPVGAANVSVLVVDFVESGAVDNIQLSFELGEGCTPGYWKQEQHFDSWAPHAPNHLYSAMFGVGPNITMLAALNANGGGVNPFLRHSTAALLNASSGSVDYAYSAAEVIAMVQAAFASGDFEGTKNLFEAENEMGCPLN